MNVYEVIGAVAAIVGVLALLLRAFRAHDVQLVAHEEKILNHEKRLSSHKEQIEELTELSEIHTLHIKEQSARHKFEDSNKGMYDEQVNQKFSVVHKRVDAIAVNVDKLVENQADMKAMVARIDGYITAKNEKP